MARDETLVMPVALTRAEWHHFSRVAELRRISMSELVREALRLESLEETLREERARHASRRTRDMTRAPNSAP